MARIKQGLWYLCTQSFRDFDAQMYYYCPEDNTLLSKAHKQTCIWPDERKNFKTDEVIKIKEMRE